MARDLAEVLKFGRYEPLFRIGMGGMAEVYAARILGEGGFQKQVAVKRMLPHLTGDQKFVDMFLDEARLAANISSPHVVQTLDLGRAEDDSLYIVMELIVGVNLSQIMIHLAYRREHVEPTIGLELISQAAQGLDDAHEAQAPSGEPMHLVHRDVSPQNILVGVDGRARMTDFGIAHALYLRNTHTRVGEKKGKFSYFSPEQAKDEAIDRRSDVFALGVVGWEMMTGRRLFRGQPMEALELVQSKEIPPPVRLRPDLSQEASDVVMLALERDRDRRYATAGQFASALRRAALAFGELPSPRVIGRFVEEAGGDHLARIRDTMARADMGEVPVTVPAAGTQILPEGTPTPSNPESTWVPGKGATSLITGERTFTGGLVVPPDDPASTRLLKAPDATSATLPSDQLDTILQEEGLHAAATVIVDEAIRGSDAGLEPLENAPTSAWNGQITTTPGLRRAQSRSWTLALSVGGILLLGGVGFAVALAATFDGESAETVDGPPPPRVLDVRTRPAGHQEPVRAEQAPPETAREVGVEVSAEPEGPAEETAEDGLSEGEPPDEIDEEARRRALLRRERLRREREQRTTRAERAEMRASMPTEMAASMTKTTSSGLPTGLDW